MAMADRKAYCRRWRLANAERLRAYDRARNKTPRRRQQHRELYLRNKERHLARHRAWRHSLADRQYEARRMRTTARKEYRRRYLRLHYQRNKISYIARRRNRQLMLKGIKGAYTHKEIEQILIGQRHLCYYCSKPLRKYHVEHKIPISRGGTNNVDNICCACPPCNDSKGTKTEMEFLVYRQQILGEQRGFI